MRKFDLPGRSPVQATNAIASTSHPLATATALTILREGGNAVDAAIAANATLAVVEPQMTGIGGDCFAIVSDAGGNVTGLNGSGRAPMNAKLSWYQENGRKNLEGAHSVTVPGALRGWEKLHARYGSMDWARLFADAVGYAHDGYPVAPRVWADWKRMTPRLLGNDGARKHLLLNDKTPDCGSRFTSPALGNTLERIAKHGAGIFYEGEIAAEIAANVQQLGGFLSEEDLAACEADWVDPISTSYKGYDILEIPPNGQGITALVLLNLLTRAGARESPDSPERWHQSVELGRIAYAMRNTHISDPATMTASVAAMLSDGTTSKLFQQYNPDRRNDDIVLPEIPNSSTIYMCVVDRDGLTVSFINSIYAGFGSAIVTPQTGIVLHNRGEGFRLTEGHPNVIGPGKRPLHTIIPGMIMKNNKPVGPFGVMGGQYQPMGHAHVLQNMFDYGMDPQEALDFPRCFWDENKTLVLETGIPQETEKALQAYGHKTTRGGPHGGGQIILIDHAEGILTAGSEPRKDGHAAGF